MLLDYRLAYVLIFWRKGYLNTPLPPLIKSGINYIIERYVLVNKIGIVFILLGFQVGN